MEDMTDYLTNLTEPFVFEQLLIKLERWLFESILVWNNLAQLAIIARVSGPTVGRWITRIGQTRMLERAFAKPAVILAPLAVPIVWLLFQWFSVMVAVYAALPHHLVQITVSLLFISQLIKLLQQMVYRFYLMGFQKKTGYGLGRQQPACGNAVQVLAVRR